jgi:hypothetical protein
MAKDSGLRCEPRRKRRGIPYYRQAKKRSQRAERHFFGNSPPALSRRQFSRLVGREASIPASQASDGSVTTAYTSILVAPGPAGQVLFQLI